MNFEFSDEQRQLRDTVERYLADRYPFEKFRSIKASAAGWDRTTWTGLAELGVLALNVPAEQGGMGFGALETLSVMDVCGRSLLLEPFLESGVIATVLLGRFAEDAAAAELLARMARGESVAVLAHYEPDSRFDSHWVSTGARRSGEGYVLDGHKAVVMQAGAADVLLVSARTSGKDGDANGVSLFRIPCGAQGLTLDMYPILDGRRAADVYLKGVQVPTESRLAAQGEALPAIEAALDIGLAALCAEAVGVMQALLDATVSYVQSRQQFGVAIGRFQALQHRIADMLIHLEQARSMSYLAALRCADDDLAVRHRALCAAKTVICQSARFIAQQAVQLHGGMGMTDELIVSHWFKRLTAAEIMFGDSETHLQRYAALTQK